MLVEDYILGIADLTGELMRYAINCVGKGDHNRALEVCQFLRNLKSGKKILNQYSFTNKQSFVLN